MGKISKIGPLILALIIATPLIVIFFIFEFMQLDLVFDGYFVYKFLWIINIDFIYLIFIIPIIIYRSKNSLRKNIYIIIPTIVLSICFLVSITSLNKSGVSYDSSIVSSLSTELNTNLPKNVKVLNKDYSDHSYLIAKINDKNDNNNFFINVSNDKIKWDKNIGSKLLSLFPRKYEYKIKSCSYYSFYNKSSNEYNTYPESGTYNVILVAYDYTNSYFVIIYNVWISY